jgi:hypothetical protein
VIFAYSGYVSEPVLSGEALKRKLTIDDGDTKTLRSVFAVFVEQMHGHARVGHRCSCLGCGGSSPLCVLFESALVEEDFCSRLFCQMEQATLIGSMFRSCHHCRSLPVVCIWWW